MKLIPDRLKRLNRRTPLACKVATVFVLLFTVGMFTVGQFAGARYAGTLTLVILFFIHLLIGAGAGFAILRLWYYRDNPLIRRMAIYMHAAPVTALTSIVLLFMARGVTLTWKFSITLFAGTLLADLVRLSFIVYVCRGDNPHTSTVPEKIAPKPPASPDMNAPS